MQIGLLHNIGWAVGIGLVYVVSCFAVCNRAGIGSLQADPSLVSRVGDVGVVDDRDYPDLPPANQVINDRQFHGIGNHR